jgi:hypothetical protein
LPNPWSIGAAQSIAAAEMLCGLSYEFPRSHDQWACAHLPATAPQTRTFYDGKTAKIQREWQRRQTVHSQRWLDTKAADGRVAVVISFG